MSGRRDPAEDSAADPAVGPAADPAVGPAYRGYAYSYPHKSAYRPLDPPVPLAEVWAEEPRQARFLYLHVPFCEMRCGFCNLFTRPVPEDEAVAVYLAALERQARVVREALGPARYTRLAIGGGTPTYLETAQLERLLAIARDGFSMDLAGAGVSVETSPATATPERLALLRAAGVDRISVGVQSFDPAERRALARPEEVAVTEAALARLREAGFPVLNADLIYGIPGQTEASWVASLERLLTYRPEEIYLYPLYVRPRTGMGRRPLEHAETRPALYRRGRDLLRARGYRQLSMRFFRRVGCDPACEADYCCQEDAMVGLGCGARSYTRRLHHSSEYAVSQRAVRAVLEDWVARPDQDFAEVAYGVWLDPEEQRRRYLIKSLLRVEGLDRSRYRARFGGDVLGDLPALTGLLDGPLVALTETHLRLTTRGLERSDALGPWLYSAAVRQSSEGFELR